MRSTIGGGNSLSISHCAMKGLQLGGSSVLAPGLRSHGCNGFLQNPLLVRRFWYGAYRQRQCVHKRTFVSGAQASGRLALGVDLLMFFNDAFTP